MACAEGVGRRLFRDNRQRNRKVRYLWGSFHVALRDFQINAFADLCVFSLCVMIVSLLVQCAIFLL